MKFHPDIPVYGNPFYRGECHLENVEQASFFGKLRREHPDSWGRIAIHPRNEGLLINGQFQGVIKHQIEGMAKGAPDIVIPGGAGGFVCELKRLDHTKSSWQKGQIEYLQACQNMGAFVCVALGAAAAWQAFGEWVSQN